MGRHFSGVILEMLVGVLRPNMAVEITYFEKNILKMCFPRISIAL